MAEYRIYFIDHNDHIRGAVDLAAPDDLQALRQAKSHPDPRIKEVWRGARLIGRLRAPPPAAAGSATLDL